MKGYRLCARTEGKSPKTISAVTESVGHLERFLQSEGLSTDVYDIGPGELRAFILYLQQKRRYSHHPYAHTQPSGLSGYTINSYMRAIRAFWTWMMEEEIIQKNPFARVKIPKAPRKVVPAFSASQIQALLGVIDTNTGEGFRDYTIILTLLDSALRVSELTGILMDHLWLDDGVIKVMGKGGKERLIPIGKTVQRLLWKYISLHRPQPVVQGGDFLFLTADGRRISRDRVQKRMAVYGERARLTGVRCSPHTLRHTAAVSFLRNGGNVFSLQRLLGHTTLQMTRHYCELADIDVKQAHIGASPVDNLTGIEKGKKTPKR